MRLNDVPATMVALMEEMASLGSTPQGEREPGEPSIYAGELPWHREFYSKHADNLEWAKEFMERYERKHGQGRNASVS